MFGLLVTTMPEVPGYRVKKILGLVYGMTIRTRGLGGQIVASLESLVGGEIVAYMEEVKKARVECIKRMVEAAKKMGANAVIKVDFETSDMMGGTATLFAAYGTAVVLEKVGDVEIDLKDDLLVSEISEEIAIERREITVEDMHSELVKRYISIYGAVRGEKKLEEDIHRLMKEEGISREDAIKRLYSG